MPAGINVTQSRQNYVSEWNLYINPDVVYRATNQSSVSPQDGVQKQYDGWIADGISVRVADATGVPLAQHAVTFTLPQKAVDDKNFWFVKEPCITSAQAWNGSSLHSTATRQITLLTDSTGRIYLDGGNTGTKIYNSGTTTDAQLTGYQGTWGYLRKGQDTTSGTIIPGTAGAPAKLFPADSVGYWPLVITCAHGAPPQTIYIRNYTPTSGDYRFHLTWPGLRANTTAASPCPAPNAT